MTGVHSSRCFEVSALMVVDTGHISVIVYAEMASRPTFIRIVLFHRLCMFFEGFLIFLEGLIGCSTDDVPTVIKFFIEFQVHL